MPFQISFSHHQSKPPAVVLLSAGADQQVFCGAVVVLEATVDDPAKLPGHPLEWEQLEGNPVILSCPTCLITTYPLGDLTDKTFRFWIDRGTIDEQYDDVSIFHTPTSTCPQQSNPGDGGSFNKYIPASSPECSTITRVPPPPELQSSEVDAGLLLVWDQVERVDLRPFVTQYTVYEAGIPVQTTDVSDPREYFPATETTYQILTEFDVNSQYSSELSCEADFSDDDLTRVIDDYNPYQSIAANPKYSRVNYGNITEFGLSVNPYQSSAANPRIYNRVNYGNIVIQGESESINPPQSQRANPVLNITRYDSGGIGG